jgi:hypothetical protein
VLFFYQENPKEDIFMIKDIIDGDATNRADNPGDIIIGMNSTLAEPSAIGRPFTYTVEVLKEIKLGSVLTFKFDEERLLHMLICHKIGEGGWEGAHEHVRFGMDYLRYLHGDRKYGIVEIGNGPIGRRDGANVPIIRAAMTDSYLDVNLIRLPRQLEVQVAVAKPSLGYPFRIWDMKKGEREIRV